MNRCFQIKRFCLDTLAASLEEDNNEGVEECLKAKLIEGKIDNKICMAVSYCLDFRQES